MPYPRAIAADDEMLRTLLRLPGLPDPGRLFAAGRRVDVRNVRGRLLTTVSFPDSPLGVPGLSFFHQPSLERELRAALTGVPGVQLEWGKALIGLRDEPGGVRLDWQGSGGSGAVLAAWVVGCDGAGSLTRRLRGITYEGRTFAEPWIVVDLDTPEPLAHLPGFTYVLDPRRPSVNMPRPGGHRFEFMALPGEDPAVLASAELRSIAGWRHIWHPSTPQFASTSSWCEPRPTPITPGLPAAGGTGGCCWRATRRIACLRSVARASAPGSVTRWPWRGGCRKWCAGSRLRARSTATNASAGLASRR